MDEPITRVIVWTGQRWVDQETGVFASNLGPPAGAIATIFPETPYFDSDITTRQQVQAMIDEAFQQRIAGGSNLHYFVNDNLLVSYGDYRSLVNRIQELHERLFYIEHKRPWYKLW